MSALLRERRSAQAFLERIHVLLDELHDLWNELDRPSMSAGSRNTDLQLIGMRAIVDCIEGLKGEKPRGMAFESWKPLLDAAGAARRYGDSVLRIAAGDLSCVPYACPCPCPDSPGSQASQASQASDSSASASQTSQTSQGMRSADVKAALDSLGLDPFGDHTAEAVRRAYRLGALKAHPDKPGGSAEALAALVDALGVVTDAMATSGYT